MLWQGTPTATSFQSRRYAFAGVSCTLALGGRRSYTQLNITDYHIARASEECACALFADHFCGACNHFKPLLPGSTRSSIGALHAGGRCDCKRSLARSRRTVGVKLCICSTQIIRNLYLHVTWASAVLNEVVSPYFQRVTWHSQGVNS